MNYKFNENRGVTLVALTITVVILLIVTNIIIYNVKDNLGIETLRNMQSDIEKLNDKVANYYAQYGEIPANRQVEYTTINQIKTAGLISEKIDTGKFYIIDLSAIENLTLTYGKDYNKIKSEMTEQEIQNLEDIYIINEASHNIFYVKGIEIKGEKFYTNYTKEDIDTETVNLRYVENVKIPDGYKYIEGTKQSGITIENSEGTKYQWVVEDRKITTVPTDIQVDSTEDFVESVNLYGGYYKSLQEGDNTFVYIQIHNKWSETYDIEAQYKDKNGEIAVIPKGFKVSQTKGKNEISKGLVIQDEQQNTYVWIPVPKEIYTNTEYAQNNGGNMVSSDTDYSGIYNILSAYASEYRSEGYIDKWYALDGDTYIAEDSTSLTATQKNLTNGCGLTYDEYINLRSEMLKSIYNKGGFWISQYEIGAEEAVETNNDTRSLAGKKNLYPYNFITCSQAENLVKNLNSEEHTKSLLFGIQWDLTMKYLEERSVKTQDQIKTKSSTWGNYENANFDITNSQNVKVLEEGQAWTELNQNYTKENTNSVLLSTGATKRNSILNIYDLAGNVWEWTLEASNDTSKPSTVRGGSCYNDGETYPASYRYNDIVTDSDYALGFRIAIY